ncbi:hypothetical protein PM082_009838 [Marasmius tenuissimus]|nr:hypothetical protein PM082_009838 [Marasmius tenuissimus]
MTDKPTTRSALTLSHVLIPPKPRFLQQPPPPPPDRAMENLSQSEHRAILNSVDSEQRVDIAECTRRRVSSNLVGRDEERTKREYEITSSQCPGIGVVRVGPSSTPDSQGGENDSDNEPTDFALVPRKRRKTEDRDSQKVNREKSLKRREANKACQRAQRKKLKVAIDALQNRLPLTSAPPSRCSVVEETARFIDSLQTEIDSLKAGLEVACTITTGITDSNESPENPPSHTPSEPSGSPGEQPTEECSIRLAESETESDEPVDRNAPYWSSNHFYTIISDPEPYDLYPQLYLPISPTAHSRVQKWYTPISPGLVWLQ